MITQNIRDQRLASAASLISSGSIKLLSIDVFDTLVARRVPKPTDVFLRLGLNLQNKNWLGVGQTPDSFAAIRYQTEYAARDAQQRQHGNREVTLVEIYAKIPLHVVRANLAELVAAEVATEHELCFANPEIVQLTQLAKQHDIRLCLISNSYFSEQALRNLIQAKAPDLPKLDGFFVSCEHRKGKRDGLMQTMLDRYGAKAVECLHIGDDPISDRETAMRLGMPCVYFGYSDDFSARLAEEHPIQWQDRITHYTGANGDYGLSWLRRQSEHWRIPSVKDEEKAFYVYGTQMLGPLLTGFAAWAKARAESEKAERIYGIAREGELLTELISVLDNRIDCRILATSRLTATLASFSPDYPDHLEDFLTRRGHWTLGTLMDQLGFSPEQTKIIGDAEATLATLPARELAQKLLGSPLAKELFKRSAERRKRLLSHLKKIGALENKRLFLLDLGYAATIQRALQRIFTIEKLPITTHGLYLVSAHVSLATQAAGGVVEGFLAQNGNPNDFARAFCRSPEVVELSCMPPHGTVIDYDASGAPLHAKDATLQRQQHEIEVVQHGIKDFAKSFRDLIQTAPTPPDFGTASWKAQIRAIATRVVIYPSLSEAELVGHWQADSDLGLTTPRSIVSTAYINNNSPRTAEQLVALPRRDIPWLYGVAACLGHTRARQVASLMLRKEEPSAFSTSSVKEKDNEGFFELYKASPPLQCAEATRLQNLCETAFNDYLAQGRFERTTWMKLLIQPSSLARQFIYLYLAKRFEEHGETKYAQGLLKKAWRIGGRDYTSFKALRPILDIPIPGHEVWIFLREACLAAAAAHNAEYVLDAVGFAHAMAYKSYNARVPYTPFQDCISIAAATHVLKSLRPRLHPLEPIIKRPIRLCYVLASEIGEHYSPLTDITFALAEAHDSSKAEVAVVSTHTEEEVMRSTRVRTRVENLRTKGQKVFFWPKSAGNSQAINLQNLAIELSQHRFDALIFTALTNMPACLAVLRPARLMVGIGLGNHDMYTSPLLDFAAHISAFPIMDAYCQSYRLPEFMPPERFHKSSNSLTKAAFKVPDDSVLILSSGRAIKFFSESYWAVINDILVQRPHVHLAILGPTIDDMRVWLNSHVPENLLPRIHFLGWRNDHGEVLATADIMLDTFPQGGGYSLTEAMNFGIPTVVCRNKTEDFFDLYEEQKWMPIGEYLKIPELNFNWDDMKGIEEAILRLIDQPELRRTLSQAVRQVELLHGDAKQAAESLEGLIKQHLEPLEKN